jgi:hypothetical protein
MVANALHNEDLSCRELSHVDEVATTRFGELAYHIQYKNLGQGLVVKEQNTCKEGSKEKAHLNSDPLEVRGQVVLNALWLQGL